MDNTTLQTIARWELDPIALRMLGVISENADENGRFTASNATLADLIGRVPRTVQNARARLEEAELITVEQDISAGRKGAIFSANTYTLNLEGK